MTVIVYRDGIMASDSLVSSGPISVGSIDKIKKLQDGTLVGCCGIPGLLESFADWVDAGATGRYDYGGKDSFAGVFVRPDGTTYLVEEPGHAYAITAPFIVQGSGHDIALGALCAGTDAITAVKIAMANVASCGGALRVLLTPAKEAELRSQMVPNDTRSVN